jgi:hypothetical protein
MLPVDEPIVALGPSLQIFRGALIALILLPLRKTFFEEQYGLVKLAVVIIGFSLLSTIGPTMGSFDGYIFTKIPYRYQLLGYPEAIAYVLLFVGILKISVKYGHKKFITPLSIAIVLLIILMGVAGYIELKKPVDAHREEAAGVSFIQPHENGYGGYTKKVLADEVDS